MNLHSFFFSCSHQQLLVYKLSFSLWYSCFHPFAQTYQIGTLFLSDPCPFWLWMIMALHGFFSFFLFSNTYSFITLLYTFQSIFLLRRISYSMLVSCLPFDMWVFNLSSLLSWLYALEFQPPTFSIFFVVLILLKIFSFITCSVSIVIPVSFARKKFLSFHAFF